MRGGARHLARDDRMIGGGQRRLRHDRHLELAWAIFGEKRVWNYPGGAQRGCEDLAEAVLAAEGAQRIGVARAVGDPGIQEFLLESRHELQARQVVEFLNRAAQEIPRTAFPEGAVGIADVTQEEVLDRRPVGEIDAHLDCGVGHDHEIPGGAERRVPDRPERRHHQIAASPADALLQPRRNLARRKPLAARQARDVASRDKDEFFPDHATPRSLSARWQRARLLVT